MSNAAGRLGRSGLLVDGRYRLGNLLGVGGFGEVWEAVQEVEGASVRPLALKLLSDNNAHDDQPWLNEVRAIREVRCASITTIYDVGIARDPRVAFIAMELLRGETLEARLRRQAVYWRRALAVAREMAAALRACHQVDVIHCDLKPHNVFVTDDGRICVLDFGVASLGAGQRAGGVASTAAGSGPSGEDSTGQVALSELPGASPSEPHHHVLGTPGYIPPEGYERTAPTPAGDVYALGVVLYRMIAGRLPQKLRPSVQIPNTGGSREDAARYRAALAAATVQSSYLRLADAAAGVPPAVCALVDRLMATDPADRPVADLVAAVDEAWHRPYGVPDPPYVGLEALDRRWAGYIAGRDADREDLVARLRDRRAVVLSGPSGCGKSSLATAGVAARLDEAMLLGTDGWQVAVMRPSQARDPVLAGSRPPGEVGLVLVIDQLEEVLGLPEAQRHAFCDDLAALVFAERPVELGGLTLTPADPLRVIATARDDLFGRLAALPELRRFPEQNLYTVRGVEPNAIRAIVAEPARASGYTIEDADAVVAEATALLAADPSALPLVQFALTRWWEQRDEAARALTRSEWAKIGGIEGALADSAEELYASLSGAEREAMRQILVELFRPDGTRVRVAEGELAGSVESRRVLDELASHRLIRRQQMERGTAVEVVHEALARRWPKLRAWLEESRAERELIQEARYDAERWQRRERGPELLWRGSRLQAAVRLRARMGDAAEFIDASAAEESSGRRKRRVALGGAAVLAGAAAILLFSFLGASEARERAEEARTQAERERTAAEAARTTAEIAAAENERLRTAAERDRTAAMNDRSVAEELRKAAQSQADQAALALAKADADRVLAEEEKKEAMQLRREAEDALGIAQQGQKLCQQRLEDKEQKFGKERALLLDKIDRCERALPPK